MSRVHLIRASSGALILFFFHVIIHHAPITQSARLIRTTNDVSSVPARSRLPLSSLKNKRINIAVSAMCDSRESTFRNVANVSRVARCGRAPRADVQDTIFYVDRRNSVYTSVYSLCVPYFIRFMTVGNSRMSGEERVARY